MVNQGETEVPKGTLRWLFWLILSCLSVFFAEVVTGSSPTGVFSVWGVIALIPLYGLHAIILAALTHRRGTPHVAVMVAAGAVFGLYEAYITKVAWHPYFPTPGFRLIGLDMTAMLWVILAYHPLMSFLVPVAVADALCLHTGQWRLWTPVKLRGLLLNPKQMPWTVAILGLLTGIFNATTHPKGNALFTAIMMLSNAAFIALLVMIWNRRSRGEMLSMKQVLPTGIGLLGMGLALEAVFLLQGSNIQVALMPALRYQISIWVLYALFIWMFWRGSRQSLVCELPRRPHAFGQGPRAMVLFGLCMGMGTILGERLPAPVRAVFLIVTILWIMSWSWWMYYRAFKLATKRTVKAVQDRLHGNTTGLS
ncbi:MAG: hypothetical protein ACYC1M_17200 [Armatimonadota bacterium]